MKIFEECESEVRSYIRSFPVVFTRAVGSRVWDDRENEYIDFFSGAGALNYGHNHPYLKARLIEYLRQDGIVHALDMATSAKAALLESMRSRIFEPRELNYKVMFTGPTGTNAIEAALKIARKVTGRTTVVAFTNGFHGMTLGALALTGNGGKRGGAGVPLEHVVRMPFDGYLGPEVDTFQQIETCFDDPSSGVDAPAAIVVETIQAEGGINPASLTWLRRLRKLAQRIGALFIVDDIQVGCGRTGPFFSFEPTGIQPDIVCLSKSLSGSGLPMAVVLLRPEFDCLAPGEHNGTFRGNNAAFVTAAAALERFWSDDELTQHVSRLGKWLKAELAPLAERYGASLRGRGLIWGLAFERKEMAVALSRAAFERGLILETSGPHDEVAKLMPPLVIEQDELARGLEILKEAAGALQFTPELAEV